MELKQSRTLATRLSAIALRASVGLVVLVIAVGVIARNFVATRPREIAIFGDSIIEQMAPLQQQLELPLGSAKLLGWSGNTIEQLSGRVGSIPSTAQEIMVEGGVNDIINFGTADSIVSGYRTILNAIAPNKHVVLIGILPIDEGALRWPEWLPRLNNRVIAEVNANLTVLCHQFPNCAAAKESMTMDVTSKTRDGIHLTLSGYKEWAIKLSRTIK
jgi:hypothetical protein